MGEEHFWVPPLFFVLLVIYTIAMKLWLVRVNRLFVQQLLSEFDGDGVPTVTFVLAHPTDETYFFTPTFEVLTRSPYVAQHELKIRLLVLSKGKYVGRGDERTFEMEAVCNMYNVLCTIMDEPYTQEGPQFWDTEQIATQVEDFLKQHESQVVITFDQYGADSDPNHISTFHAVNSLKEKMPDLRIWALRTYGVLTTYSAPFALTRATVARPSATTFTFSSTNRNSRLHVSSWTWKTPFHTFFSSYSYANSYLCL
ncbi:N-ACETYLGLUCOSAMINYL-PH OSPHATIDYLINOSITOL DE-N-ACETYLASE, putative [Babesia bigemina]|uniref:N-acetylglucosaminylphosphatidylinositol deacetylase n=1 Tax=Babesia bigemina TaxID=5866 RepID=A0A061D813_BABBI|nr:N-ACETYLGLUCOSAMINYL-PH OSPHATIDYLINOSITOL DE-N-ACETYLASE, putative [Babesia bigemina]CDR96796.1 N-ACETYLGLUCOSAMINYL-PH OSPHATIDYLINOSITOL DE-N-ACETYLASE, putative [Babesia bigemina]|eukprot:XP_012768982.1 N-ACETYLGLUCOSAMINYL-PH OSPHATIDYLINOSITOL DE-N-ACETYLASE, putative [Babesia bigemina]